MTTIEDLDEQCPDHDRTSCSDEYPSNAGIDFRYGTVWCRRCEGIWQIMAHECIAKCEARGELNND